MQIRRGGIVMKCPSCQAEVSNDSRFCSKCGVPFHPSDEIIMPYTKTILRRMDELSPGTELVGKYKVNEVIGKGGMGIVYKAQDLKLMRDVALKFLPSELMRDKEAKERFVLEAQTAAALSHPNICTIHEINEEEGKSFIAMEYVEGQSLKDKLDEKPIPIDEALRIAIQITKGLEQAHKKGIIHRDIKSANIMVSDEGQAKIMDFGLAKVKGGTLLTREGTTLGTVAYMSPEQARNEEVGTTSDIWSLGVVLYEMISGQLPFKGDLETSVMYSIVHENPRSLREMQPDIPSELQKLIDKALSKKPESRYVSVEDMKKDLMQIQNRIGLDEAEGLHLRSLWRRIRRPQIAVPLVIIILVLSFFTVRYVRQGTKIQRARKWAIPEINRLAEDLKYNEAYKIAREAEEFIPNDAMLLNLWSQISSTTTIFTEPSGARVYRRYYPSLEEDWEYIGETPIKEVRIPFGYSMFKLEKEEFQIVNLAAYSGMLRDKIIKLHEEGELPEDMIWVPGGEYTLHMPGLEHLDAFQVDDYLIDKYEVTNKEYRQFIDSSGYEKQEYWKFPFEKDGKVLSWEEAISLFKDKTGRQGPATWEVGEYPAGQEDYPVAGISWYEAAAYAEFIGKSLPTIYHWNVAANTGGLTPYILPLSNFEDKGSASIGKYKGMSSYGAYDMAGNVREWCLNLNKNENNRFILGGGWNDQTYMYNDAYSQPPFDRSITNGFRCMKRLRKEEELLALESPIYLPKRDYWTEEPVPDDVFDIYLGMYKYDKTELNAEIESVDDSSENWVREKVTFDAAYGGERVIAYLYLPKKKRNPPFQTIVYFPGSSCIHLRSFENMNIGNLRNFDFIVKEGRAVMHPIYKGTYERGDALNSDYANETTFYKDHVIMWAKDYMRSIDYLETRKDIDVNKLAYYGFSWGGVMGAIIPAVENRLKASVLHVAGFGNEKALPEVDQINFITRVKIPVLMLNGKYDHYFPVDTSQRPFFKLLGTRPEDKRQIIYEAGHFVPRNQHIKETLDWLDRYLGPVK
jgi:serine/threonine protein kinase/formylglycine-generating enzyme required for sulfatase activity/dienelactone hydrolase